MVFVQNSIFRAVSIFILFIFSSNSVAAQCAGADTTLVICNISDPANKTIDLFALLGPTATPGGAWNNPTLTLGFNPATGILNAWNIRLSGTYTFTYTVNNPGCADNNATVTVIIGGYAGVPSPGAACDDDSSVNLFQFFDGTAFPSPQFGGIWTDNNNTGAVSGNFLNATLTGLGTFTFTYTIPGINSCPIAQETIFVTVYPAPDAGTATPLVYCENDDFSGLTNVNLLDYLSGEDINGDWSETSGTSEISNTTDSFINIQNIFNTNGPGEYLFRYFVFPNNPVCSPKEATISLKILEIIDLTGGTLVVNSDICENQIATASYQAILTQGTKPVPNGSYNLTYTISGPVSVPNNSVTVEFASGVATFPLNALPFNQVGAYTVTITGIIRANEPPVCDNIADVSGTIDIYPQPNLDTAIIDIDPICLNSNGTVELSGIGNLAPGNYQLTYTIVGANVVSGQTVNINVTGNTASFVIPSALLANTGNSTLIITNILNVATNCSKAINKITNFIVRPLPDLTNLAIVVPNVCKGKPLTVAVSGLGTLTSVSVIYNLSGANSATAETAVFTATGGAGNFIIPATLLPYAGQTQLSLTVVTDAITNCSSPTTISANFEIYPLPDVSSITAIINDVCKNQPVTVLLSGLSNVPSLSIAYSLSGANTATQTIIVTPNSGNATFVLPSGLLVNAGTTVFTITNVTTTLATCASPMNLQESFVIHPLPDPTTFDISIPNVCQGQPVSVLFSNLGTLDTMNFQYTLSGANTATTQTATIAVTSGAGAFVIPSALLPNIGSTTIVMSNVQNPNSGCVSSTTATASKIFTINPLPNAASLSVSIADFCKNQPVSVSVSGLGNVASASITYTLSGANVISGQIATLAVNSGNAVYVIPAALLANIGDTTFTITNLSYTQTNCSVSIAAVSDVFRVYDLPNPPTVSNTTFCKEQNPTVSNLIPGGTQYSWYSSATATTPLDGTTPLIAGDYYVSETSSTTNCPSPRAMLTVTIIDLLPPILNTDGQNFCGANKPTLQDLTNNTSAGQDVVWYDAPQNGTLLPNSQLLQEGNTYYGFQFANATGCMSSDMIEVRVTLTDCDDDDDDDFFIPDGFSPNNDSVNDTFRIPNIEFLYPDFTLEIYNRYGNLIFKGNKNKPFWDGRNSQSSNLIDGIAPNGVYFYVINFNKNNASPKQGRLYLNR